MESDPEYMTLFQAAASVPVGARLSISTLRDRIKKGILKGRKMYGSYGPWVVRREDFLTFLDNEDRDG